MTTPIRRSTTEIGLAFEKHSQRYLNTQLHMSLRRVGRAGDGGVDLRGSWYVPREAVAAGPSRPRLMSEEGAMGRREEWRRLRIVGQCKAEKKGLGPRAVRELEGVVAHLEGARRKGKERCITPDDHPESINADGHMLDHPLSPEDEELGQDIIAILLSQSGFSKNAMLHASKSHTPLMLVHLPGGQALHPTGDDKSRRKEEEIEAEVGGVWWNAAMSGPVGVLGGKMELRREILEGSGVNAVTGDARVRARYRLYHSGKRFGRLGPGLSEDEQEY